MKAYYLKSPSDILKDVPNHNADQYVEILGINFVVLPHVYPSQCFRTTNFLLKNLQSIVKNKTICDMGCGMGVVGVYSLLNGATKVVQADINPDAVVNTKMNKQLHVFKDEQAEIYQSDCFDNIPLNTFFDVIVFNIPFHSEQKILKDWIEYSLFDPNFDSLKKFLLQAKQYSHKDTQIIIAFSNKGDTKTVESLFAHYDYEWTLWRQINKNQKYDNRLYKLHL